jgi:hypothetical protein
MIPERGRTRPLALVTFSDKGLHVPVYMQPPLSGFSDPVDGGDCSKVASRRAGMKGPHHLSLFRQF